MISVADPDRHPLSKSWEVAGARSSQCKYVIKRVGGGERTKCSGERARDRENVCDRAMNERKRQRERERGERGRERETERESERVRMRKSERAEKRRTKEKERKEKKKSSFFLAMLVVAVHQ